MLPDKWATQEPPLCSALPPGQTSGRGTASISDRRGNSLGPGEGALDMGMSRPNFHPESECQLRGPASPASPHRLSSKAQAGLSDCAPAITLTSYSVVSREGLTRRTQDLWVLEHWPQGLLRGSFGSSQGGLSSLQLLTTSACPSSRCPPCLPPCCMRL